MPFRNGIKMTKQEIIKYLMFLKRNGRAVNNHSTERFPDGTQVRNWLIRHRKNLTLEELKKLGLKNRTIVETPVQTSSSNDVLLRLFEQNIALNTEILLELKKRR